MGAVMYGESSKPQLKLDGNKVIVKNIGCYAYDKKTDVLILLRNFGRKEN